MAEAEILHRLHTHAATDSWSATGWKQVPLDDRDAGNVLPREVLFELDGLMTKITPAGSETAWAVRRFAADADTYACVIASYPDLVDDRGGRMGLLTHARLVRVPATNAAFDVAALVELAEGFALSDVRAVAPEQRLRRYLDLLSTESAIPIRDVSASELDLPRAFLCDALTAMLASISRREQTRVALPAAERTLIADLARAWAAIPVALQRTSAWAMNVADGCPVDVIFATASGKKAAAVGSERLVDFVSRYVSLLLDSARDFRRVLRNPDMTSVAKLDEALRKAEPLTQIEGLAMKKPRTENDTGSAELDRQYRAIEASLRNYIDQRLAAMPQREAASGWSTARVMTLLIVAIVATAALMAGLLWMFPPRVQTPEPQTIIREDQPVTPTETITTTTVAVIDALEQVIDTAAVDGKWAEGLKTLIADQPAIVSSAVRSAATKLTNAAARKELEGIAKQIDDKKLTSRDRLRVLWMDAIQGKTKLADLKQRLGVMTASNDAANIDLQSEIILRSMLEARR